MSNLFRKKKTFMVICTFFKVLCSAAAIAIVVLACADAMQPVSQAIRLFTCMVIVFVTLFAVEVCDSNIARLERQIKKRKEYLKRNSLFNMSYPELCDSFNRNVGGNPITERTGRIFGRFEWVSGSLNDNIRTWVINNGLPYLNSFNGNVWFSENGDQWQTVEHELGDDGIVTLYECVPLQMGRISLRGAV